MFTHYVIHHDGDEITNETTAESLNAICAEIEATGHKIHYREAFDDGLFDTYGKEAKWCAVISYEDTTCIVLRDENNVCYIARKMTEREFNDFTEAEFDAL